jgi:hypothetical protein
MADLEKFAEDLKKDPPRIVSAGKLDRNFRRCLPAKRGLLAHMNLNFTDSGWHLEIPAPPDGTVVLGAVGGVVQWIRTQDCQ